MIVGGTPAPPADVYHTVTKGICKPCHRQAQGTTTPSLVRAWVPGKYPPGLPLNIYNMTSFIPTPPAPGDGSPAEGGQNHFFGKAEKSGPGC